MANIPPVIREYMDTLSSDYKKSVEKNKELVEENKALKYENENLEYRNSNLNRDVLILAVLLLVEIIYIAIKIHTPEIDYDPNVL